MSDSDTSRSAGSRAIGIATALMCALAGGAVWCVLALYSRQSLTILALAIAAIIAWALRSHGFAGSKRGALIAAVATALACFYSQYLLVAADMASLLGLPLRTAAVQIGPGMATALIQQRLSIVDIAVLIAAIVFAALLTWRRPLR